MRVSLVLWCAVELSAPPRLRLSNSVVGPVTVAPGVTAPTQMLEASNVGDGALALTLTVESGVSWLAASAGAPQGTQNAALQLPCYPLQFQLKTAGLAAGAYSREVSASAPPAEAAAPGGGVVVRVGPPGQRSLDLYMAPGSTYDTPVFPGNGTTCFTARGGCPGVSAATQDGGTWLSVAVYQPGTFRIYGSYMIHLAPPAGMAP